MADTLPILHFDPQGDLGRFLRKWFPPERLSLAARDTYRVANSHKPRPEAVDPTSKAILSDGLVGMPVLPWRDLPPQWMANSVWFPTGASRTAIGLIFTNKQLDAGSEIAFHVSNAKEPWTIYLEVLSQLALSEADNCYLTILVDRRYRDRHRPVGLPRTNNWNDILAAIPFDDRLEGFQAPTVPPDEWLWNRHLPAGLVIDAMAACAGQRIVFDTETAKYIFQTREQAQTAYDANRDRINGKNAVARISSFGPSDAKVAISEVSVSFPVARIASGGTMGMDSRGTRETRQISVGDASDGVKLLTWASQPILYGESGGALNETSLDAVLDLIKRYCEDWHNQAPAYHFSLPITARWDPCGFDDYVWIQYEQLGAEYTPKILISSLPPITIPVEWPLGKMELPDQSTSVSEPSVSDSLPSSSPPSESSQSSEPSQSEPSESSASSTPSESQSQSEPPPSESWSGSDKSSAIVPASWSKTGYVALFIHEMPEVRFDDVMVVNVPQSDQEIAIDPRFVEVCVRGSLEVCGVAPDKPILVGARAHADKIRLRFAEQDLKHAVRLVIRLTGIRRGFAGKRFPARTRAQFEANEAFINSAYPSDPQSRIGDHAMTNDQYQVLASELRDDLLDIGYSAMTAEEAAASLNEPRYSVPTQRFVTWRAIAAVLDDDEYAATKTALNQLASMSAKVADMLPFLSQATGDDGTGGGIDFGNAGVRAMIQALPGIGEATKQKLLALGERPASRAEILGLPQVYPGHIESARNMI